MVVNIDTMLSSSKCIHQSKKKRKKTGHEESKMRKEKVRGRLGLDCARVDPSRS